MGKYKKENAMDIKFNVDKDGRFFSKRHNVNFKEFGVFTGAGESVICTKRCEICKFLDVEDIDDLDRVFCNHEDVSEYVNDSGCCLRFDISKEMMQDIYDGCIK